MNEVAAIEDAARGAVALIDSEYLVDFDALVRNGVEPGTAGDLHDPQFTGDATPWVEALATLHADASLLVPQVHQLSLDIQAIIKDLGGTVAELTDLVLKSAGCVAALAALRRTIEALLRRRSKFHEGWGRTVDKALDAMSEVLARRTIERAMEASGSEAPPTSV